MSLKKPFNQSCSNTILAPLTVLLSHCLTTLGLSKDCFDSMVYVNVSASEVSLWTGFVAMESAGTAIQLFGGFENVGDIR